VDAFIGARGGGYVELALTLGVAAGRYGARRAGATVLAELAGLIAGRQLEVLIANVYPLAQVREAYTELERRHTHGKIILRPS
jgi:NADPH:quinone reductase-like Zn-dependent oxidoreductase